MIDWTAKRDIAVITISNPPLNASNHAVRSGLMRALHEIEARDDIRGIVLTGDGANFVAGSDIKEFGAPLADPQMPDVIAALEACPLSVVAAIRGACLGGGYELSLGCDYRFAAPDAVLGLPEVGLGILPGAGGTQKLPRLIGVPKAIEMILGARRVKAEQAAALGMIDKVVADDLLAAALEHAATAPKRRIIDMPVPAYDTQAASEARAKALRRARHRPAAVQSAELIENAAYTPIADGLHKEREVFQNIRVSPEAFALRHVFFAERAAAKFSSQTRPDPLRNIAVIGGGTMGAGIAYTMLKSGLSVALIERDAEAGEAARGRVEGLITSDAKRGFLAEAPEALLARFTVPQDGVAGVVGYDLVIEAVFENMEVKTSLLTSLMPHVGDDTLIATNTSYLDVDEMAQSVTNPGRFFGLHFFSPAHRMSLVEVVRGAATSEGTIAAAFRLARKLGKQPVLAGNAYGFIGNRIYAAYRRHAEYALQDGASVAQIDAAIRGFGMAMGPFEVADMSGLDIAWRMRQARGRVPGQRYVDIPDMLCEAGRFGRKTGAGYYLYTDGAKADDPQVDAVIETSRKAAGIAPQPVSDADIQARLIGAIVVEAAQVLDEGIAQRAGDIDVALIHGYGFPRWTGGPLYWARQLPRDDLRAMLEAVKQAEGRALPTDKLLQLLEAAA